MRRSTGRREPSPSQSLHKPLMMNAPLRRCYDAQVGECSFTNYALPSCREALGKSSRLQPTLDFQQNPSPIKVSVSQVLSSLPHSKTTTNSHQSSGLESLQNLKRQSPICLGSTMKNITFSSTIKDFISTFANAHPFPTANSHGTLACLAISTLTSSLRMPWDVHLR